AGMILPKMPDFNCKEGTGTLTSCTLGSFQN
ncbi:MNX1 isoform 2, partial [Pan troglodytes]